MKEAARRAIAADVNQYAITWGAQLAARGHRRASSSALYGVPVDPEREITVTCGSTEAMIATLLALLDPGDEVVVFEPFYENYGPDAILSGAVPRFVKLRPPDWTFDPDELARAFSARTRAIIVNTPQQPDGQGLHARGAGADRRRCARRTTRSRSPTRSTSTSSTTAPCTCRWRRCPAWPSAPITINGMSKTYSVTGWRVGWAIAPPELTERDPQGARLPDRRRGGAAAGGGRAGAGAARVVLQRARRGLRRGAATGWWRSSSAPASASTGRTAPTT